MTVVEDLADSFNLLQLIPNHPQIWTSFMAYKERVPVCGAILISEFWDKVRRKACSS
jgi:hypothetical protein